MQLVSSVLTAQTPPTLAWQPVSRLIAGATVSLNQSLLLI